MEKKQIRNLVILACVLLICIVGYFCMKNFNEEQEAASEAASEAEEEGTSISSISADEIVSMSWKYDGTDVTIEKGDDDVWFYGSTSLNEAKPSTMKHDLADLSAKNTITGDDVNLESFGLNDPSNVISAKTSSGDSITVTIGIQNEVTSEYYCYINDDSSTVYTISSTLYNDFNTDPEDIAADSGE
ncbi:MAG: DUF4340 domain-containing protein [Lachnospiraceae bacterium]|nr:DUF4340 domain-containing protein [Lachnospiraceae bacterium]